MIRTHTAGSLRATHAGQTVTLAGWAARRRDHGGVAFIDLRDGVTRFVQVVIRTRRCAGVVSACAASTACASPALSAGASGQRQPRLATGESRSSPRRSSVLSEAEPLPFQPDENAGEESASSTATSTCARGSGCGGVRTRNERRGWLRRGSIARFRRDREPDLTWSTPEGARDFLVPARLQPGWYYALPPVTAAVQAAADGGRHGAVLPDRPLLPRRGPPGDRQPEFTQLDMEMSFVTSDDVHRRPRRD